MKRMAMCVAVACLIGGLAAAAASASEIHEYAAGETYLGPHHNLYEGGYENKLLLEGKVIDSYIVYGIAHYTPVWEGVNTYKGIEFAKQLCTSEGAKLGEVKTNTVALELGWISKAKAEVGILERPAAGGLLSKFTCGENVVEVRGNVIGTVSPINKAIYAGEQFTHNITQEEGKQTITHFEGGAPQQIEVQVDGGGFEPVATEDLGNFTAKTGMEISTSSGSPEFVTVPEWYECAKSTKGTGYEKGCYSEGKGGYQLVHGIGKGKALKGKGAAAVLHTVVPGKGDIKVECAAFKEEGTPALPNREVGLEVTYSKCKALGSPCQTEGAKKETIVTQPLSGEVGFIEGTTGGAVGLSITNEAQPGVGYLTTFECPAVGKVRVFGSAIATVTGDVETISNELQATFAVGPYLGELASGYTPLVNPPKLEDGPLDVLLTEVNGAETGNVWGPPGGLPSGFEGKAVQKGEKLGLYW